MAHIQQPSKRYMILRENTHTGEIKEAPPHFNDKKYAEIARACWNFGSHLGWIKDTETGEIF